MELDPDAAAAWLQANGELLTTIAGAAIVLILGGLIIRAYRRGGIDSATMLIAAPLVIGWEAEGIYEVLRSTDAPWFLALLGCGMTSMVMVNLGAKGHRHFQQHGTIGPNGRTVWYIAIPVGVIVAASATTASMQGLRILIPILGATLWWSEYRPDEPKGAKKSRGSLRWTPRNFFIWVGAIRPGADDVDTLHHARGVRLLVNAQFAVLYGWAFLRPWRAARLRRVARKVTPEMVAEAREQMARVKQLVEECAPGFVPAKMTAEPHPEQPDEKAAQQDEEESDTVRPVSSPPAPPQHPVVKREVAKVMARNPGIKPAEIASKLGMSDSTARRYHKQIKAEEAAKVAAEAAAAASSGASAFTAEGQTLLEVLADITAGRREPLSFAQIGELFGEDETWAMEHIRPHIMHGGRLPLPVNA